MAKNEGWYAIVKGYRQQINEMRKQIASAERVGELFAKKFVERARDRLGKNNNAKDQSIIEKLKGNIYAREGKDGWQIVIRQDPEGLMTFLEYGTGLLGQGSSETDGHPEAIKIGWDYRQNDYIGNPAYRTVNNKRGWFFRSSDPNIYIDKNDSDRREGGTLIFSQGIEPVRYIYETRIEFENLIRKSKGDYVYLEYLLNHMGSIK